MPEQRTEVHIATTNDRATEARQALNVLRDQLKYDRHYTGPIETWTSGAPGAPTRLSMYLKGDVQHEVERRLADMAPTFDVSVEVWEELIP